MKKITDETLNDYIDNQLGASEINELKHDLDKDSESLRKLHALKVIDENLKNIEVYPAPNNFTEKVMEQLFKQVKVINPAMSHFFKSIVSVFGLIIVAVLVAVWNFVDKKESSSVNLQVVENSKEFVSEYLSWFGNLLGSNHLVLSVGIITVILFLGVLLIVDSHRNFKNRLKSVSN